MFAVVSAVVVAFIGFFSAQLWQAMVVHQQLTNACDAAGLAAASSLASSSYPSLLNNTTKVGAPNIPTSAELQTARQNAAQIAFQVFRQSIVCGNPLTNAVLIPSGENLDSNLPPLQSEVVVNFSTVTNGVMKLDNSHGTHVTVTAATAVLPFFPTSMFPPFVVQATGRSCSAKIDLAFCLDNSLSLTVDTLMYVVSRGLDTQTQSVITYWFPTDGGAINNTQGTARSNLPAGWGEGSPVRPQYINSKSTAFSPQQRGTANPSDFPTNTGEAPGQMVSINNWTDAVVLPSGNDGVNNTRVSVAGDQFGTLNPPVIWTYSGNGQQYTFNNIATMVEASRGNLESITAFYTKYLKGFQPGVPAPQSGYQAAYEEYAMANTEPFHGECVQVSNFFQLLMSNTDAHVSFIPFGNGAGTPGPSPGGQVQELEVGPAYDQTYKAQIPTYFPFLQIPLQKNVNPNLLSQVFGAITALHNYSPTLTDQGLLQAYGNLVTSGQTRPGAKRIAMLLSDGEPTDDPNLSYTQAQALGQNEIPLFAIAFLHGSQNQQEQASQFMQNLASTDNGAAQGGDGSQAYTVSQANMAQLQQLMRLIAHQYATLE